jgi:hypothetical protein
MESEERIDRKSVTRVFWSIASYLGIGTRSQPIVDLCRYHEYNHTSQGTWVFDNKCDIER